LWQITKLKEFFRFLLRLPSSRSTVHLKYSLSFVLFVLFSMQYSTGFYKKRGLVKFNQPSSPPSSPPLETLSQCHSEALAEESLFSNLLMPWDSSRSLPWAQNRDPSLRSGWRMAKGSEWQKWNSPHCDTVSKGGRGDFLRKAHLNRFPLHLWSFELE